MSGQEHTEVFLRSCLQTLLPSLDFEKTPAVTTPGCKWMLAVCVIAIEKASEVTLEPLTEARQICDVIDQFTTAADNKAVKLLSLFIAALYKWLKADPRMARDILYHASVSLNETIYGARARAAGGWETLLEQERNAVIQPQSIFSYIWSFFS